MSRYPILRLAYTIVQPPSGYLIASVAVPAVHEPASLGLRPSSSPFSVFGDLVSTWKKRVTVGARSMQWLGQISDATLHQLSRDRGPIGVERT